MYERLCNVSKQTVKGWIQQLEAFGSYEQKFVISYETALKMVTYDICRHLQRSLRTALISAGDIESMETAKEIASWFNDVSYRNFYLWFKEIQQLMYEKRIPQGLLAKRLGYSKGYISKVFSKKVKPTDHLFYLQVQAIVNPDEDINRFLDFINNRYGTIVLDRIPFVNDSLRYTKALGIHSTVISETAGFYAKFFSNAKLRGLRNLSECLRLDITVGSLVKYAQKYNLRKSYIQNDLNIISFYAKEDVVSVFA